MRGYPGIEVFGEKSLLLLDESLEGGWAREGGG